MTTPTTETPLTDEFAFGYTQTLPHGQGVEIKHRNNAEWKDFARQLERRAIQAEKELAEVRERVEGLAGALEAIDVPLVHGSACTPLECYCWIGLRKEALAAYRAKEPGKVPPPAPTTEEEPHDPTPTAPFVELPNAPIATAHQPPIMNNHL